MRRGIPRSVPVSSISVMISSIPHKIISVLSVIAAFLALTTGAAFCQDLSEGLSIDALEFEYSADSGTVVARGNVRAEYLGLELECDELVVNLKEEILLTDGYITKCDLAVPCWRISARRLVIYPKERIVAEGVWLWVNRFKILPLPRISLPIYEEEGGKYSVWGRNLPRPAFTYDKDYGFSAVLTYPYTLSNGEIILLDAAYREKAGCEVGASLDHNLGKLGTLGAKARYRSWEGPEVGVNLDGPSFGDIVLNADALYRRDRGLVGGISLRTGRDTPEVVVDARRDYISGRIVDALPRLNITVDPVRTRDGGLIVGGNAVLGRFREGEDAAFISKAGWTLKVMTPQVSLVGGVAADAGIDLSEFWYSTGHRLSTLDINVGLSGSFGSVGRGELRYIRRDVDGATPFAFDAVGEGNELVGGGLFHIGSRWTAGVNAVYNLNGKVFTDVDWTVTRHFHCFDVKLSWREKRDEIGLDISMVR